MELTILARRSDGLLLAESWEDSDAARSRQLQPYKQQAKKLLRKLGDSMHPQPLLCSVESGPYFFHYKIVDAVVYMAMCGRSYPKKLAFIFLEELRVAFEAELKIHYGAFTTDYAPLIETIKQPYYFVKFDRVIQKKKAEFRDSRSSKAMQKLNESLAEVTEIMKKNIDDVLQRGENLEDVSRKAEDLKYHSKKYSNLARYLSFQALVQKYLPVIVIVAVLLIIVLWRFVL